MTAPDTGTANYTAAVALITRAALAPDVPRSSLLDGVPADDVLRGMEVIAAGLVNGMCKDHGADLLQGLGLYFATTGAAT